MKSLLEELNQFAVDTRQVYGGEEHSSGRGKAHSVVSGQVEHGEEFVGIDDDGHAYSYFITDSGAGLSIYGC
ncbi:MAG: hypothetical protein IJU72_00230 [Bacteroidales bacterium]|nr:hypothetical protein [Bacteroidales bacterium]